MQSASANSSSSGHRQQGATFAPLSISASDETADSTSTTVRSQKRPIIATATIVNHLGASPTATAAAVPVVGYPTATATTTATNVNGYPTTAATTANGYPTNATQQQQQNNGETEEHTTIRFNDGEPRHFETVYRGGFSTSLCDLFQDPRDRSSCCALTCCGTFLEDRNRYLLTGELPPPWWMRILIYLGGFLLAAILGGLIHGIATLVFPLAFLVGMCMRATSLRQELRQTLQVRMLEARPHDANISTHPDQRYMSSRNEHWCCALVSNDKRQQLVAGPALPSDTDDERERQRRQQADFCFRLWQCLSWMCCDACCYSWCHWCGMCATGQEDRELRRLLPPDVFLRDYITFQPYGEYYPPIEWLRAENTTSFWKHLGALSQLSAKLLYMLQCSILVLLIVATLHIVQSFSLAKVFVVVLTLAQAFLILYLVYWRNHRMDVSLDAIIKFFASGFVLAMMVAIVVEMILDTLGEIVFSIVLTDEYIEDHPEILEMDDDYAINNGGPFSNIDTFKNMAQEHYMTLMIYLFFKAVIVAGLVEELTKYFCFWMVEHPDYIYGSPRHVNEEMGEEGAFCNDNAGTPNAGAVTPPTSPSETATTNIPTFRPRQAPNHTTAGAAITVGMIATAAGFSCSENLMYVFSQNSVAGEISVLLARSLLPVHSICAAIQSIGVVRRDVEQDSDYKIGWAIFPAVMLHGMFDFILLALSFFEYIYSPTPGNSSSGYGTATDDWFGPGADDDLQAPSIDTEDFQETFAQQVLSFSIGAALTMIGVVYYVNEAGKQRNRLQALELTTAEVPSTAGLVFA